MLKKDFVKKVAEKANIRQVDAALVMDAIHDVVVEAVAAQDEVKPFNGLTLCGVQVDARIGRNPQTGEAIDIPAHTKVKARFAPSFKAEVNQ